MNLFKQALATSLVLAMASSSAIAAGEVRASTSAAMPSLQLAAPLKAGTRVGKGVAKKNDLLGAPLFLVFLGAVAVTIGTIVVVDNGSSPG
jgi:hypothetical protein